MSDASFNDDGNLRNYEIILLGTLLKDAQMFKLGLSKLNKTRSLGFNKYSKDQDFVFPVHNVIWDCAVLQYMKSGMSLPTFDTMVFGLGCSIAEGTLSPFELESAVDAVRRIYSMSVNTPFVMGTLPQYLKKVKIRQVEDKNQQGHYKTEEDYMAAYQDALKDSRIDSVESQGMFPFMDISFVDSVVERIPTCIKKLDRKLGGGAAKGELIIWVAVSGGGKTIALNHCCITAARAAKRVFVGTCELVPDRMRRRLFSCATGILYDVFKGGASAESRQAAMTPEVVRSLHEAKQLFGSSIFIRDYVESPCTLDTLDRDIEEMKKMRNWVPDVVVIDYFDKIVPPRRYPNHPRLEYKEIGEGLVRLAVKHNVVMYTATQANVKAVGRKVVDMTNMSEAYSKAWAADVILGVSDCVDGEGKPTARQVIYTAKNRDNERASIDVIRDFARQRFLDVSQYEDSARKAPSLARPDTSVAPSVAPNVFTQSAAILAKEQGLTATPTTV